MSITEANVLQFAPLWLALISLALVGVLAGSTDLRTLLTTPSGDSCSAASQANPSSASPSPGGTSKTPTDASQAILETNAELKWAAS